MNAQAPQPIGVVLAGGLGRRLGGPKATVALRGRPLISYPLQALRQAVGNAVIVAKMDSELPPLPGIEVWIEPDLPRHPLTGLVHALSLAGGAPIVVCACDLPLVSPALIQEVASADPGGAPAVIASSEGRPQPLLGCYQPTALSPLAAALGRGEPRLVQAVSALRPRVVEVADPMLLLNVNAPEDLLQACAVLSGPPSPTHGRHAADQPNVKS